MIIHTVEHVSDTTTTSKTPEGRSATFRVQGLVFFFSFIFVFFFRLFF